MVTTAKGMLLLFYSDVLLMFVRKGGDREYRERSSLYARSRAMRWWEILSRSFSHLLSARTIYSM
jgi:hypothetical protein